MVSSRVFKSLRYATVLPTSAQELENGESDNLCLRTSKEAKTALKRHFEENDGEGSNAMRAERVRLLSHVLSDVGNLATKIELHKKTLDLTLTVTSKWTFVKPLTARGDLVSRPILEIGHQISRRSKVPQTSPGCPEDTSLTVRYPTSWRAGQYYNCYHHCDVECESTRNPNHFNLHPFSRCRLSVIHSSPSNGLNNNFNNSRLSYERGNISRLSECFEWSPLSPERCICGYHP